MGGRERHHDVGAPFSLAATCGPVAWGGGRWPDVAWSDGRLTWMGRENGRVVHRVARQVDERRVAIEGTAPHGGDAAWLGRVLGVDRRPPTFDDPVLAGLTLRWPGLRPLSSGSLLGGLVTSLVGQSVSVAAAAVTATRLAALFHPGEVVAGRRMHPLPTADELAGADPAALRSTGTTWRRAEALVAVGRAYQVEGEPSAPASADEVAALRARLLALPLVGRWTAESALLWGLGEADVHPSGDAALLRAARRAYGRPDLDHAGLDRLAATWRPHGGWAARLLWLDLLGPAPP